MVELFAIEYLTILGMTMVLLFLDSRYSRKKLVLITYGVTLAIMALVAALYQIAGLNVMVRCYSLVAHIPAALLLLVFSRFRGWRLLFQLFSSILFCALIQHGAGLVYYLSGSRVWAMALAYVILTGVSIWFLVGFLRPLFFQALLDVRRGWWMMCAVIAAYYVIVIYLIPGYVGSSLQATILKPAISLLMVGFYSALMFLFSTARAGMEARHSAQLASLQLSALQNRMEALKAVEDTLHIERHDLRHRLQIVSELVARGDKEDVLNFLDSARRQLDHPAKIRWCRPPVLDAVFSSYFSQAQYQGIQVDAKISLSEAIPGEENELAIILANALENAIQANMDLPRGQRVIRCRMVGAPSVMLEISNPCNKNVTFDDEGLPVARREGHGLGVQSISAFCRKYGAVCQFRLVRGWFHLRLVL